jgi:hypothetical protein
MEQKEILTMEWNKSSRQHVYIKTTAANLLDSKQKQSGNKEAGSARKLPATNQLDLLFDSLRIPRHQVSGPLFTNLYPVINLYYNLIHQFPELPASVSAEIKMSI